MDETGADYTECSKPEKKKKTPIQYTNTNTYISIQYTNTYIWNLERW